MKDAIVIRTPLSIIKETRERRIALEQENRNSRVASFSPIQDLVDQINSEGGKFRYPDVTYGVREGRLEYEIPWRNAEVCYIKLGPQYHIGVYSMLDEENYQTPTWVYRYVRGGRSGDEKGVDRYYTLEDITTIILNILSEYVI